MSTADTAPALVPDVPTATEAYAWAWPVLTRRFVELVLLAIVWMAIASPAEIARKAGAPILAGAYYTFVVVPLNFGALKAYLEAVRGRAPRVTHLFDGFRTAYVQILVAHVLWITLVGMGFALLVVPGLVIATRLSFVGFLVIDEGLDAVAAVTESWRRTSGYAATLFGVFLLGIPLALLGLLMLGAGIVPAIAWTHLAFATVFDEVTASDRAPA
jgi:hypothetical protein